MRTRAPLEQVTPLVKSGLPILGDIIADSNDLLTEIQIKEMDEPGIQYEAEAQKARAIRRIATEVQDSLRKLVSAMQSEIRTAERKAERAKAEKDAAQ